MHIGSVQTVLGHHSKQTKLRLCNGLRSTLRNILTLIAPPTFGIHFPLFVLSVASASTRPTPTPRRTVGPMKRASGGALDDCLGKHPRPAEGTEAPVLPPDAPILGFSPTESMHPCIPFLQKPNAAPGH